MAYGVAITGIDVAQQYSDEFNLLRQNYHPRIESLDFVATKCHVSCLMAIDFLAFLQSCTGLIKIQLTRETSAIVVRSATHFLGISSPTYLNLNTLTSDTSTTNTRYVLSFLKMKCN